MWDKGNTVILIHGRRCRLLWLSAGFSRLANNKYCGFSSWLMGRRARVSPGNSAAHQGTRWRHSYPCRSMMLRSKYEERREKKMMKLWNMGEKIINTSNSNAIILSSRASFTWVKVLSSCLRVWESDSSRLWAMPRHVSYILFVISESLINGRIVMILPSFIDFLGGQSSIPFTFFLYYVYLQW